MKFNFWLNTYYHLPTENLNPEQYQIFKERMREVYEAAQPKWQPIETGPKDEIVFILYKDGHAASISRSAALGWVAEKEKYSVIVNDWEIPTHWMSLPPLLTGDN